MKSEVTRERKNEKSEIIWQKKSEVTRERKNEKSEVIWQKKTMIEELNL
jgi:hypothetical protein